MYFKGLAGSVTEQGNIQRMSEEPACISQLSWMKGQSLESYFFFVEKIHFKVVNTFTCVLRQACFIAAPIGPI